MFDAKSLIEMMMKGAAGQAPSAPQGGGLGGLGDLLGKMVQGGGQQAGGSAGGLGGLGDLLGKLGQAGGAGGQASNAQQQGGGLGGLGEILGKLGGGAASGQGGSTVQQGGQQGGGLGGGLEDMLRKLGGAAGGQGGQAGGGLMDILGQVLGQATSGVREGAQKADDMTGASARMKQATGQDPGQLIEQLKELVRQNQLGAGAAAGGLGAVVLGTKTGRALAGRAIKLGGLALIGGLAYKALQNYQSGKPLIAGAAEIGAAPSGSGFETAAVTQDSALLYIRTMIAAAAADGRIDATEQQKLMGNLQQLGINSEAEEFLARELNNPATPEDLAGQVRSQEEAVQVFTAARLAIDLDSESETDFLVRLAGALGISGDLAEHIDAAARAA